MLHNKPHPKKAAALLLSAVMLLSSVQFTPPAKAANEWVQDAVNRLSGWGVITGRDTGDQQLSANITRAEFTAMVNRAYGYTQTAATPFTDVPLSAWYSDDISIGYNTGYFSGTTETTAEPESTLTREQAISLLARNLRLEQSAGEVTQFTDGRDFSTWSMGYVKAAAENGIVSGYSDGTFRPKNEITRAEMIQLLSDSLGTLVNSEGVHMLGGVAGNVTINTPNATLRDTTIAGDLYLTGGVGLGGVVLDNVNVLGRIIVAGGGESEGGDESIVLRNVAAQAMLVDSMADQYVSLSVQNDTIIPETTLKSNAFIQDFSGGGMGLQRIVMDGDPEDEEPMNVTLSGNIKTVVNRTPGSRLIIGDGTAETVTIDERAVDSTLTITNDGVVENLNLDVGIAVDGEGDVGTLTVNAAGASTSMLPDDIIIRPGITANIAGTEMDTKLGEEASSEPRLLAGYPDARDIAPTSVLGVFEGNKSGTVYYAVTAELYGPVEDDEILVNPPTYGPTYTARGQLKLTASNTEASVRIGGLTVEGTYYLSAVLVDARGDRSPVKWVKFTTPNNTVPAFTTGYPVISKTIDIDAQLSAMTNKDCEMYYAIFPKGSAAPTANNFLSNSLTGAIATGVYNMSKNTPITEWLTGTAISGGAGSINGLLEEQETYDLYLWLIDKDAGLSSAVRKLTFTTVDVTPPEFVTLPYVTNEAARAVTLTGSLNEDGTIYWVAVPEGEMYPKPAANGNIDTGAHAVTVNGGLGGGTYLTGDTVTIVPETITDDVFYRWSVEAGDVTVQMVDDNDNTVTPGTATFRMPDAAVTVTAYFISREDADNNVESPRLIRGTTITTGSGVALDSEYAKLQVRNGMNAFKRGSTSARELADFNFTVSGLNAQTRYDVYYVAVDKAGNFSNTVHKITVNTLDNIAPKATQEFTRFADGDSVTTTHPYANTDIRLIFDEEVTTVNSTRSFLELYQDVVAARNSPTDLAVAQETLGSALASSIQLYTTGLGGSLPEPVGDDIIDFRKAVVELEDDGKMVITFRTTSNDATNALHLRSGATYFFRLKDITDTSTARNRMAQTDLPRFTTISAQVFLQKTNTTTIAGFYNNDADRTPLEADIAFSLTPRSTSTMDDSTDWDMLLWLNQSADFDLYRRVVGRSWERLGSYTIDTSGDQSAGISIRQYDDDGTFPQLNKSLLESRVYEYAVHFTQIGNLTNRTSWSQNMIMQVNIMAGLTTDLRNLAANVTGGYTEAVESGELMDISSPNPFKLRKQFDDQSPPSFVGNYPKFETGDTNVIPSIMLDRTGTVYWMIAPVGVVRTLHADTMQAVTYEQVPEQGGAGAPPALNSPTYRQIIAPRANGISSDRVQFGTITGGTSEVSWTVQDLEPNTEYFAYFVVQGNGQVYSPVQVYGFKTQPIIVPHYTLTLTSTTSVQITEVDNRRNNVDYKLIAEPAVGTFGGGILQREIQVGQSTMTVLDALYSTDAATGLSIFDVYAETSLKQAMVTAVRSQVSDGASIIGTGSTTIPGNGSETVDCLAKKWNLSENVRYIFLSVGQTASAVGSSTANDPTSMSFRAIHPIRLDDLEAPKVTETALAVRHTSGSNPLFSGTCTVVFNENIYRYEGDSTPPIPIDNAPTLLNPPRDDSFASIESLISTASGVQVVYNNSMYKQPTAAVQLQFSNLGLNQSATISFTTRFCDAKPNRRPQELLITLTPRADRQDAQGNWIYEVEVTVSPDWDARPASQRPSSQRRTSR